MPVVDVVKTCRLSDSMRCRQLESMFDVPRQKEQRLHWHIDVPIESKKWNVGLIVGPSGAGKTTVARSMFASQVDAIHKIRWTDRAVIDDFANTVNIQDVAAICQAVGFNTIPAWLRPFAVLSNGEQFRVTLARLLAEHADPKAPIVFDEFTSVVDRQVAQIGSHAVQKNVRKRGLKFVAVSCHYDIVDWLQPDWVLDMGTQTFSWRSLQQRPKLDIEIGRVGYDVWRIFAPFHYLTADLNKAARCFALTVNGRLASFAGVLHRPHPTAKNIKGISRVVTLPDFQGLGLAFVLMDRLAAMYKSCGFRLRSYPAHPALIRGFDNNPKWRLDKKPGYTNVDRSCATIDIGVSNSRPCAVFEYVGPRDDDASISRKMVL